MNEVDYSGMTVNERLSEAGLLQEWNEAAKRRDREKMIEILKSVQMGSEAERTTDTILKNPAFYGF